MAGIRYPAASAAALLVLWGGTIWADDRERSADDTFRAAEILYSQHRYDEVEPYFARIATICEATERGEGALYFLAECQYQQKKYIAAFETFERLHTRYPATSFREQLVNREYEMAEIWLARANGERALERPPEAGRRIESPRSPGDFRELSLRAFLAVRQNDPTGARAESAAIRLAGYYMNMHDYDTAEIYYTQFVMRVLQEPAAHERPGRATRSVHARLRRLSLGACLCLAHARHRLLFVFGRALRRRVIA